MHLRRPYAARVVSSVGLHPSSRFLGILLLLLVAVFCAAILLAVDRHSHSVRETLYGILGYVVPCFMLLHWWRRRGAAK